MLAQSPISYVVDGVEYCGCDAPAVHLGRCADCLEFAGERITACVVDGCDRQFIRKNYQERYCADHRGYQPPRYCRGCGGEVAPKKQLCGPCRKRYRRQNLRKAWRNYKSRLRAKDKCVTCIGPLDGDSTWHCEACLDKRRRDQKERRRLRRLTR